MGSWHKGKRPEMHRDFRQLLKPKSQL